MKPTSLRIQLWSIGLGYAAVMAVAAALLLLNYLKELTHLVDVSGGMYAFGQLIEVIFIACLFMIPTIFLVRVMERYEGSSAIYSQLLIGISVSAPVCLGLFLIGEAHVSQNLMIFCVCRLVASPFVLVGIGVSRLMAQFNQAKKLAMYALVIEGLTLAIAVAYLFKH